MPNGSIKARNGCPKCPEWENRDVEKYGTYEVVWMPVSELKNKTVYPFEVRDKIFNKFNKEL